MIVESDGYQIDFTDALSVFKFDDTEKMSLDGNENPFYHGVTDLKAVDIIAELPSKYVFVEIKDYKDIESINESMAMNEEEKKERRGYYN